MRKATTKSKARSLLLVTALTSTIAAVPAPSTAAADAVVSTASASVGKVDVMLGGEHVVTPELAQCGADGPLAASTSGGVTGDVASFGNGSTHCGRTGAIATGESGGRRFSSTVLKRFGGPELTARTFGAKCVTTTDSGSAAYVDIGQVTGITVPSTIPSNYTITIPGGPSGTAMATVVVNEVITPDPADGSLMTNALHIQLFPQGGPASGDIYLGSAHCDPFGKDKNK